MSSNKKLTIIAITLVVAIVAVFTSMIIVLVATNQSAETYVSVEFEAIDVEVDVNASVYVGGKTYTFKENGSSSGSDTLSLSKNHTTGTLSQVEDVIEFGSNMDTAVFKYVFTNRNDLLDCKITLQSIPSTIENLEITYYATNDLSEGISYAQKRASSSIGKQLLAGYEGETTVKTIYIFAKLIDASKDAEIRGSFSWLLNLPNDGEVSKVILSTSDADYVERVSSDFSTYEPADSYIFKTFNVNETPDLIPAKTNYYFSGWDEPTPLGYAFANYIEGNIPTSNYVYEDGNYTISSSGGTISFGNSANETEVYIPDIYQLSGYDVGKVTKITGTSSSGLFRFGYATAMSAAWSVELNLGNYVETIGTSTCSACLGVNFNFNKNLKSIEDDAFSFTEHGIWYQTGAIYSINLEDTNIESIGANAFNKAFISSGNKVKLPETLKTIGDSAFSNCNFTTFEIPDSVTTIGWYCFSRCENLESVKIGNSLIELEYHAFEYCGSLTDVKFGDSVKVIKTYAFRSCTSLESIIIPDTVDQIYWYSFDGCSKLNTIYFEDPDTWQRCDSSLGGPWTTYDVTNFTHNATLLTSAEGLSYYWRKV